MYKRLILFGLFFLRLTAPIFAQNETPKQYFDKSGRSCSESVSYYYRQESDTNEYYRCFYSSNGRLYFKGKIKLADPDDESKNVYAGTCFWYHKNGNLKQQRNFTEKGVETGTAKYYYESGKTWKEIDYENGRIRDNTYIEYNEDGSKSRLFEDEFTNNYSDWDLYASDKSTATIANGKLELIAANREGTSRYINHSVNGTDYVIEAIVNIADIKENDKVGLIYGFKDWQNYHYFVISRKYIYVGSFFEGVKSISIDGMYCSSINPSQEVSIKILSTGDKDYFSINGEIQYKDDSNKLYGNNFGFIVSGKSKLVVDRFTIKEMNSSGSGPSSVETAPSDKDVKATGSGIIFSSSGYILTNYHVIENSNKFIVELNTPTGKVSYNTELVLQDKENDLAIIKIKDDQFKELPPINYSFKENGALDVGGAVFTIGYPHALSGMGKEAKFTDGKISSKTGYNGSMNSFQTSIPVQPGNSGGPVFNENGQLIGVINATFRSADNVSYAIKLNYIRNLIELLNEKVEIPASTAIATLSLEEKLKILTNYVVLVKIK